MKTKEIINQIEKYDVITIYRHKGPDGDAYGSQVGLKELILTNYPNKQVYCLGETPEDYARICGPLDKVDDDLIKESLAIVVDVGDLERVDDERVKTAKDIIKIDHHIKTSSFGHPDWVDTKSSSACEMVVLIAKHAKWKISINGANALYLGMTTDAARFLYCYTPRMLDCAKWLVKNGAEVERIYRTIYEDNEIDSRFYGYCRSAFTRTPYGVGYNKIYPEIARQFNLPGSGAGNVNAMANIKGVDIWAQFTENEDGTIRAETRSKGIPVNVVCNEFGGGGHLRAAGATLLNWDEVDIMLDRLEKAAFEGKPYHQEVTDALKIAKEASKMVLDYYNGYLDVQIKDDNSPVTIADKVADKYIRVKLSELYPDYGLLSEETHDDKSRLDKEFVWVIDPIDGTKDYIAHDDEFAINIALVRNHKVVVGVIAVPAKNTYYYAMENGGAYKEENGILSRIQVDDRAVTNLKAITSRFHRDGLEDRVYQQFDSLIEGIVSCGSAYKMGLIAEGKAHLHMKYGDHTKEWDIAPGVILVKEAGGVFLNSKGEEFEFNRDDVINRGGYIIMNKMNREFVNVFVKKGNQNG